ncbi:hypothetical protein FW774_04300 (plasmid) [Pedobacter sp. BS3]|uniref:hypothetical protein n=1 Tax=Pedobacter sp. BS3 TaxID=2567937 RepID=UPI0011EE3759|nr:hypothetical protein [Pedobacter sp. BS3]TZF86276.1 hypothetical protein FW774_04300 [Pedobacter sp. BS3]
MKKNVLFIVLLCIITGSQAQVFFNQDFSSSTILTDYASTTPSANQFDAIGVAAGSSGLGVTAAIDNSKFHIVKTLAGSANGTAYFVRTTDMNIATQFVSVSFKLSISNFSATGNSQAQFFFGNNYAVNETQETASNFARLGINYATGGAFQMRDVSGGNGNGAGTFTGEQTITLILNATPDSRKYTAPDNNEYIIASGKWNVWVGTQKQFTNDISRINAGATLSNFKFIATGNPATYDIDDIVMTALDGTLPVSLTSFTGHIRTGQAELNWVTASEQNNARFEVSRSADGQQFNYLGQVTGNGTSQEINRYSYIDRQPLPSISYYQLKQVDFDGQSRILGTIALKATLNSGNVQAFVASDDRLCVRINAATAGSIRLRVADISGHSLMQDQLQLNQGYNELFVPLNLSKSGTYIASVIENNSVYRIKFNK